MDVLRLWNYVNLFSIVIGSFLVAVFSAISTYYLFKFLGFSSFSDSMGFLAHYSAIFISATFLLSTLLRKAMLYSKFRRF